MKQVLLAIIIGMSLFSCSSTNYLTLSVVEPAPVHIPSTLKKVGIVNRSIATQATKSINKLDQALSLEGKNLDKTASTACIEGVQSELLKNERFAQVDILSGVKLESPGLGIVPAPLNWTEVNNICKANEVDVLFVLESFDTNTRIETVPLPPPSKVSPLDLVIAATAVESRIITEIKIAWRIYDPSTQVVLDDYVTTDAITIVKNGIISLAASGGAERNEAVLTASRQFGESYAVRLLPYQIRVSRVYFVRGSENFKIARRKAISGNWDGAAELWKQETTNPKQKVAGRAYYNMAISNEINGDLDAALDWAQKSYENYNNKKAIPYINILKDRKYRNAVLKQQEK